jgi:hypothetical protein
VSPPPRVGSFPFDTNIQQSHLVTDRGPAIDFFVPLAVSQPRVQLRRTHNSVVCAELFLTDRSFPGRLPSQQDLPNLSSYFAVEVVSI